ncbi:MAG: hypothetical protein ACTSUE_20490 [Promethearchaeota archaeon]
MSKKRNLKELHKSLGDAHGCLGAIIQNMEDDELRSPAKRRKLSSKEEEGDSLKRDNILECPVTKEIFVWPVALGCGHTFESFVLDKIGKLGRYSCPTCRYLHHEEEKKLQPNWVIIQVIEKRYPGYRGRKIAEGQSNKFKKKALANGNDCYAAARAVQESLPAEWFKKFDSCIRDTVERGWTKRVLKSGTYFNLLTKIHDEYKGWEMFCAYALKKNFEFKVHFGLKNKRSKKKTILNFKMRFLK